MSVKNQHRRQAREMALQGLYAYLMAGNPLEQVFTDVRAHNEGVEYDDEHFKKLVITAINHLEEIDERIRIRSLNWKFSRIAFIDKLIMRLAIGELIYIDDVPPRVSITEAIEMAKIYSTDDSHTFINGILDRVYHDLIAEGRIIPEPPKQ